MNRNDFLKLTGLAMPGFLLSSSVNNFIAGPKKNPVILIVSGWQDVNIGDIAHTPGLLNVFKTFLPKAKLILWKRSNGEEVKHLLNKNFPAVKIVYGGVNKDKTTDSADVLAAIQEADIMVHGSGPSLVGADNLACWIKLSKKPFGVFGTTLEKPNTYQQEILKQAAFIYTRETFSINDLKQAGITGPQIRFAPDATFFMNIHDDEKANAFLKTNKLEAKKFIAVVPRLRYTPYHQFKPNNNGWSAEKIKQVEETNARYKELDHAKMREAMIAWVRETGNKVLVCPEMTYETGIMDELLINPLPEDVKPHVIKRDYWLPDEAASIYAKAHTVLSFECHSPIIAAVNGTPAFYLRQPEDTIKGQMYYDLGFNDWIFEIDKTEGKQITDRLRDVWKDYTKAKVKLKMNMDQVAKIYKECVGDAKKVLDKEA